MNYLYLRASLNPDKAGHYAGAWQAMLKRGKQGVTVSLACHDLTWSNCLPCVLYDMALKNSKIFIFLIRLNCHYLFCLIKT